MNAWRIVRFIGWAAVVAATACGSSSSPAASPSPWCCDLTTAGNWSCGAACGTFCPGDVVFQEQCTDDPDGSACAQWSCVAPAAEEDGGPPLSDAAIDGPAAADALSPLATVEAAVSPLPEAATPVCVPGQACGGISICHEPCYGAACCDLSCTCESADGEAGVASDPGAHLACTIYCPP